MAEDFDETVLWAVTGVQSHSVVAKYCSAMLGSRDQIVCD